MTENYDTSWDQIESDEGNLPDDEDAYERKYQGWMERDWIPWLREHLSFPFQVKRMEDEDDAYFTDVAKHQPFRLDHIMDVTGIESEEDDRRGVIAQVKEAKKTGCVPLCDLEVTSRGDRNFWPVREYVVWDANR